MGMLSFLRDCLPSNLVKVGLHGNPYEAVWCLGRMSRPNQVIALEALENYAERVRDSGLKRLASQMGDALSTSEAARVESRALQLLHAGLLRHRSDLQGGSKSRYPHAPGRLAADTLVSLVDEGLVVNYRCPMPCEDLVFFENGSFLIRAHPFVLEGLKRVFPNKTLVERSFSEGDWFLLDPTFSPFDSSSSLGTLALCAGLLPKLALGDVEHELGALLHLLRDERGSWDRSARWTRDATTRRLGFKNSVLKSMEEGRRLCDSREARLLESEYQLRPGDLALARFFVHWHGDVQRFQEKSERHPLGLVIRLLRHARSCLGSSSYWTMERVADRADITRDRLDRLERGERIPTTDSKGSLQDLTRVLGLTRRLDRLYRLPGPVIEHRVRRSERDRRTERPRSRSVPLRLQELVFALSGTRLEPSIAAPLAEEMERVIDSHRPHQQILAALLRFFRVYWGRAEPDCGWSGKAVMDRLRLSGGTSRLARIESGRSLPSFEELRRFEQLYQLREGSLTELPTRASDLVAA